jgi:hypothetical protein
MDTLLVIVIVLVVALVYFYMQDSKVKVSGGEECDSEYEGMRNSDDLNGVSPGQKFDERVEKAQGKKYGSHQALVEAIALDNDVVKSHQGYVGSLNRTTSGASLKSEPSHDNDIVPWIGLRRTEYRKVYAGDDARQTHSQYPESMPTRRPFVIG